LVASRGLGRGEQDGNNQDDPVYISTCFSRFQIHFYPFPAGGIRAWAESTRKQTKAYIFFRGFSNPAYPRRARISWLLHRQENRRLDRGARATRTITNVSCWTHSRVSSKKKIIGRWMECSARPSCRLVPIGLGPGVRVVHAEAETVPACRTSAGLSRVH
jgi:hypothetical protein